MARRIVVAAVALVLVTAAGVAFAAEDPPRVPPRGTEGPDVRVRPISQHWPCPETGLACPSGGRGVEGPEAR